MKKPFLLLLALVLGRLVFAAYVKNVPQTITQPDGKIIHCLASGDEFYHWLHDAEGFTIVMNPADGFYYYAILSGDSIIPSRYAAGTVNPSGTGLVKGINISERRYAELRRNYQSRLKSTQETPTQGHVNGLCIYISFDGDSVFSMSRAYFKEMWSAADQPSVQDYFAEVSYGTLDLQVSHFPAGPDNVTASYRDIHKRNYYLPKSGSNPGGYEEDAQEREHSLLKAAVEHIVNQIPANLNVDINSDGVVDNICFVIQGEATGGDIFWPHTSGLTSWDVRIKGARILPYSLTMELGFGCGVISHELGHLFGAPDLYHYYNSAPTPVGGWCLMDGTAEPPQGICGFIRLKYNHWILKLPEITESGVYSLRPLTSPVNNLYKVKSPYSRSEYFLLEYRRREGRYESSAPGTGLLVYRINPDAGNGNADGPPDEIYVYRPGGSLAKEGNWGKAPLLAPTRTAINDDTDPYPFLYNSGKGGPGGLDLFNVSAGGDSITFEIKIEKLFPVRGLDYIPGNGIIDLSWEPAFVEGISAFTIYRNGINYATSTLPAFRDTVTEDRTYTYSVSVFYQGVATGESALGSTVTYTPKKIMPLPYKEDFEQPGHGWKIKGNGEGFQWGDGTSLAMNSINTTRFLGANSAAAGPNNRCLDFAVTPRLNLSNKSSVFIHFDYSLKRRPQLDSLGIFFRRNRNENWIPVIDLPISGIGIPFKWKKYNLEVPSDAYTGEAQLGFLYNDGDGVGFGAAVDNVVIDEEPASGIDPEVLGLSIKIYPNPAADEITLAVLKGKDGGATLRLVSIDGKTVWSEVRRNLNEGDEKISLKGYSGGLYYLVIETADEVIIRPVVKQN